MLLCMPPSRVGVNASSAGSRGGAPPGASPAQAASPGAQHGQREGDRARQQRAHCQHASRDKDAAVHATAAPAGRLRRLSALGSAGRASQQGGKAACEVLPGRRCAAGGARAAAARQSACAHLVPGFWAAGSSVTCLSASRRLRRGALWRRLATSARVVTGHRVWFPCRRCYHDACKGAAEPGRGGQRAGARVRRVTPCCAHGSAGCRPCRLRCAAEQRDPCSAGAGLWRRPVSRPPGVSLLPRPRTPASARRLVPAARRCAQPR